MAKLLIRSCKHSIMADIEINDFTGTYKRVLASDRCGECHQTSSANDYAIYFTTDRFFTTDRLWITFRELI